MKAFWDSILLRTRNKFFPYCALRINVEDGAIPFCYGDRFAWRIWDSGAYEQGDRRLLRIILCHFHCFVDVGANLGIYTLLAARHLSERGKVFAFEASQVEFEKLKRTLAWNKLHSVIAENLAVGSSSGEVAIFESLDRSGALNRIGIKAIDAYLYQETKTQCVSLDEYFKKRVEKPDFIKIDVEGFELKVLHGARAILQANRPVLMVEMVPATSNHESNPELIWDYMEGMSYRWLSGVNDKGEIDWNFEKPLTKDDLLRRLEMAKKIGFYTGELSRNMYCVPLEKIDIVRDIIRESIPSQVIS